MSVDIQAEYINAAALFASKDPSIHRYNLSHVFVIPEKDGAMVYSTDGHIGFIAFDSQGKADKPIAIFPHKDVINACPKGIEFDSIGSNRLKIDDENQSLNVCITNKETGEEYSQIFMPPSVDLIVSPPNFSVLFNNYEQAKKGFGSSPINGNYMTLMQKMFKNKRNFIPNFYQADDSSHLYITFEANHNVLILLMPMRQRDESKTFSNFHYMAEKVKNVHLGGDT